MSAPQTNIPKQTRRHAPSLIAMALVVLFAIGLLGWWMFAATSDETPTTAPGGTLVAPQDGSAPEG